MFNKIRLLSFSVLVLATLIGFAFAPSNTAQAGVNPPPATQLNSVFNITAVAGCTNVTVTVNMNDQYLAPIDDVGNNQDWYHLVVYDGAGTVIAIDDATAFNNPRVNRNHTINDVFPNNPASYPFEIRLYDAVGPSNNIAVIEAAPLIDTLTGIDPTGFGGALGCNTLPNATNVGLAAGIVCQQTAGVNNGTVDVTITAGDGPFNITTSNGGNQNGVATGTYNFANGPTWANITVTETTGDTENVVFPNVDCTPPVTNALFATAVCVGANLRVTIASGDNPFDIDINAGGIVQNGVNVGIFNFPGPATWTDITVTETSFDNETVNLGNRTCTTPPVTPPGGGNAVVPAVNVPTPPDSRLNWGHGDHLGILYPSIDPSGNPSVILYCLNNQGTAFLGFHVTFSMIAGYDTHPDTHMEVARNNDCPAAFYILDTGEYQVNIGPDAEGKTEVVIFNDLHGGDIYFYTMYGRPGDVPGSAPTNSGNSSSATSSSNASLPGVYTPLTNCRVTTTDMVNFREFPVTGDIITIIPFDYEMTAHARSGDWFEVTFMGDTGWISDAFASTWGMCG